MGKAFRDLSGIDEIGGPKLLAGVRANKPADAAALRQLLVQISDLVTDTGRSMRWTLNPVVVHEKGLTIVDARVILTRPNRQQAFNDGT